MSTPLNIDLSVYGIKNTAEIIHNPGYDRLYEEETKLELTGYAKGVVCNQGAVAVSTGEFTGRSPKDKYIVLDNITKDTVWWNTPQCPNDNKPMSPAIWSELKTLVCNALSHQPLYVIDTFCGANPSSRLKVRFIVEVAWQAHFVKNMFIRPTEEELHDYGEPDFVVINGSRVTNPKWHEHGLNSEVFVAFNLTEKMQIIGGTWYGGEMKKGIFSMMNYYLPQKNIASMHCSANQGKHGDVAIFFGLSGTGKTTLSTDPKRKLIGDDEHGWDDDGVFNFEGGCYAKTIDLDPDSEPDIHNAIRRNALLENVTVLDNGSVDYSDRSITENTRVSYPIDHIENIVRPVSKGGHPEKIIFLTADAFGVFPAVSKLSTEQAKYYFLSGFTAKVAGTERGVTKPTPTFSACFGKAFLSLHPLKYAEVLSHRMEQSGARVYLVNTGWNGEGKRISIKNTRLIIDAILDGSIEQVETELVPIFNLEIPRELHGIPQSFLDPRTSYGNEAEWYRKAHDLARQFIEHFADYDNYPEGKRLAKAGPQELANEKIANY